MEYSSAQCTSSTRIASGPLSARLTVSQYSPWMTPSSSEASPCPNTGSANDAGPCSSFARSARSARTNLVSNRLRTTPNAKFRVRSLQRVRNTCSPRPAARSAQWSSNSDLPIPLGPLIKTVWPWPLRAARSSAVSCSSSDSRSKNSVKPISAGQMYRMDSDAQSHCRTYGHEPAASPSLPKGFKSCGEWDFRSIEGV